MAVVKNLMVRAGADFSELEAKLKKAQATMKTAADKMKNLGKMIAKPVITVVDRTASALSRVRKSLLSLQGLAVIALTIVGADKLKDATLGQAQAFETQQVSMLHWLKGNQAAADQAIGWLEKFAAATPFEMSDLFPAMSRGIGVSDGDLKTAERLVTLSADMAALTPGKTVGDAMEALADAKMGEYERLKEFNMKYSKEQADAAGGFAGLMKEAEKTFAGGADKLSKTSVGLISTMTDTWNTMFRQAGQGILNALMPRLQKISDWFSQNPYLVAYWKNRIQYLANQAAENVLNFFQRQYAYIKENYLDNPAYQNLTFTEKIKFIMDDISKLYDEWYSNGGQAKIQAFGEKIGQMLGYGIKVSAPYIISALGDAISQAIDNSWLGRPFSEAGIKSKNKGGKNGLETVLTDEEYANSANAVNGLLGASSGAGFGVPTALPKYVDSGALNKSANFWATERGQIRGNALGTDFWKGGLSWVGEKGPELVNLPRGAQVLSNSKSMAAMGAAQGDYTVTHKHYTNDGKLVGKIMQEFAANDRRITARVSTLPSMA